MKAIAKWRYRAEEKMFVGEETPRYLNDDLKKPLKIQRIKLQKRRE